MHCMFHKKIIIKIYICLRFCIFGLPDHISPINLAFQNYWQQIKKGQVLIILVSPHSVYVSLLLWAGDILQIH